MVGGSRKSAERSPAREALAEAIAAFGAQIAQRDAAVRHDQNTAEVVVAARRAVRAAQERLEQSQAALSAYVAAQAQGTAGEPPEPVRVARDALADAEDHLAAAEAAQAAALNRPPRALEVSDTGLRRAISTVLQVDGAEAASAVAAKVIELQDDLVRYGAALVFLVDQEAFPVSDRVGGMYGEPLDDAVRLAYHRVSQNYGSPPYTWNAIAARVGDGAAEWRAAVTALRTDPSSPLPGVR